MKHGYRICFERQKNHPPKDTDAEFISWLDGVFPHDYMFAGYQVVEASTTHDNAGNVLWAILADEDGRDWCESSNFAIDGYHLHLYQRSHRGETLINQTLGKPA